MIRPVMLGFVCLYGPALVGQGPLFKPLPSSQTGVTFSNVVTESDEWHYFIYRYIYNGGGVAAGDINNDGLADLFFAANQLPDKLYLNKGGMQFEDITAKANVGGGNEWTTGVTMMDINNDGWLDIYVCRSGLGEPQGRRNALFVNNRDLTFTDKAEDYGLANTGYSTQAYVLDYDRDGDMDMFLLSHRVDFENNNRIYKTGRYFIDEASSNRLYRNEGDTFVDVTHQAGLATAAWGLSAVIGDFNGDHWPDIYCANDFFQPDYLFINHRDGSFYEHHFEYFRHMSFYSMGADYQDINNDGLNDLYVLDMVPSDRQRSKQLMASMSTEGFKNLVQSNHGYQYMLNTLQLNYGNGAYAEIAQLSGIDQTDWSWAPLLADVDNDGWKDLVITNGIFRDVTDNDFKIALERKVAAEGNRLSFDEVMTMIPSTKIPNVVYRNNRDLTFSDKTVEWNMNQLINSQGLTSADLDGDGDLDLVLNNFNEPASIYENLATGNSVRVKLKGGQTNPLAVGAQVKITTPDGITQMQEVYLSRGYLSSVEPVLHFGIGLNTSATVQVTWPDGLQGEPQPVLPGLVTIDMEGAPAVVTLPSEPRFLFADVTTPLSVRWLHRENEFDDFARELLLPHKQSEHGPFISVADADNDGLEDFYIGGSKGYSGALFFQVDSTFQPSGQTIWFDDRAYEDAGSVFFDADGDKDLDLYVVSGGNEEPAGSEWYQDRLYINNGKGTFTKSLNALPNTTSSGSVVIAADIDADNDLDLFVGGRVVPGRYPEAPQSYLLLNNKGTFTDVAGAQAPGLSHIGMVTDAAFSDYDSDGDADLLVVGEWMPLVIFQNSEGDFKRVEPIGIGCTSGWWFSITADDLDGDGDPDYVLGNVGLNNKFHPSAEHPLKVFGNDFDGNGTYDIVLAKAGGSSYYPVRGRQCSSQQMPFILDKCPTYKSFAEMTVEMLYEDGLSSAIELNACEMASIVIYNEGSGRFTKTYLPNLAQTSPLRAAVLLDINGDQRRDLIGAGNMFGAEVETVRYDAGLGVCLVSTPDGFSPLPLGQTGFYASGDVHDVALVHVGNAKAPVIIIGNNNGYLQAMKLLPRTTR